MKNWSKSDNFVGVILEAPRRVLVLLGVLGLLVYANALNNPFVHDDVVFIIKNPAITQWGDIGEIFLRPSDLFNQKSIVNKYYRPLLEVLYRIQYFIFGQNPAGYRLFNIAFHVFNAFLIFLIFNGLTRPSALSLGVAVLFLLHPLQSESVAYIAGVSDVMYAFFCLASLLFYISGETAKEQRQRILSFVASVVSFILGLLSKEQAIILPFLVALFYAVFRFQTDKDRMRSVGRIAVFFIILAAYFVLRRYMGGDSLSSILANKGEFFLRLKTIPRIFLMYVGLILWPVDLHFYRATDMLLPFFGTTAGCLALVAVFILTARRCSKDTRPLLWWAGGWFVISLLPVLNIIPIVVEYSLLWTPEHFCYFPLSGVFLLIGAVAADYAKFFREARMKKALTAFFVIGALALGLLTARQNMFWKNEKALFGRTVRFEPNMARARILLAKAYFQEGLFAQAVASYRTAEAILNGYIEKTRHQEAKAFYQGLWRETEEGLAQSYDGMGQWREAVDYYEKLLTASGPESGLYNNLGSVYLKQNRLKEAQSYFEKAVALDEKNAMALNNWAIVLIEKKAFADAEKLFKRAIAVDPDLEAAKNNLRLLRESAKRP